MRRKSKYLLACLLLLLGVSLFLAQGRSTATVVKAGPTDRAIAPNILWIVAEDLSPDLGCYGTVWFAHRISTLWPPKGCGSPGPFRPPRSVRPRFEIRRRTQGGVYPGVQ